MEKKKDFGCTLLKLERIRQNKGQKEVCYGICVPSYLSKIEHNQVTPDAIILKQLLCRLGITYYNESAFIKEYEVTFRLYFEQLSYGLEKTAYDILKQADKKLTYSPLALDWLIAKGFENDPEAVMQLEECQDSLTDIQLAYYYILQPFKKETVTRLLPLYNQAFNILHDSFSLYQVMTAYYIAGQYDKLHDNADKCVSLALEEGNTYILASCYELIGSAYACLNAEELMLLFYKRAIHLLQNTNWKDQLENIYYNIGATLLSGKKYDEALQYLNMVPWKNSFLLNHKKALLLIRSGKQPEAEEHLAQIRSWLKDNPSDPFYEIAEMMYEEAKFECRDGFFDDPRYIELMEALINKLQKEQHKGYSIFFKDVLEEAYCRQRKYKKALELQHSFLK